MKIKIELDDKRAQNALARLIRFGADMSPMMRDIGEKLLKTTRDRFVDQKSPDDKNWAALSPNWRDRKPKNKDKILTLDGYLSRLLTYQEGRNYVVIGSNRVYASTHQFGARARLRTFDKTKRVDPLPFGGRAGGIPARPFLGVSDADQQLIKDIVLDHITDRWRLKIGKPVLRRNKPVYN